MSSSLDEQIKVLKALTKYRYMIQMSATVMIWDIVTHIDDDVELLLLPGRFRPPTVAYFISRLCFLMNSLFITADNSKACDPSLTLAATACKSIAIVFTLFQFFLRVKVIYCEGSWFKTGFFAVLWVLASGGAFLTLSYYGGQSVGCVTHPINLRYWAPILSILVYDSCVFLAISYQIYRLFRIDRPFSHSGVENRSGGETGLSLMQGFKARVLAFAGRDLPSLTRAILQDGQFYYFISIVSGAAALTLMLNESVFPIYRPLLAPIHPVLLNITAGHVFREVKLGRMREREFTLAFQQSGVEETLSLHSIPHNEEVEEGRT